MTTEQSSRPARYVTLRDYLRVLRHYRFAIAIIVLVGAGLGLLDAKRQTPAYRATATVQYQDPAVDLNIAGFGSNATTPPAVLAASESETIARAAVIDAARRRLATQQPAAALAGSISASVSQTSSLLSINATSKTPSFAAQLANAVSQVVVALDNKRIRSQYAAAAADARTQVASLQRSPGGKAALQPGNPVTPTATQLAFYEDELARLTTLSQFARTAQVAEAATTPSTPFSPKTVRSTILGLILGLLVAIGFAFLRDSMDRRLRGQRDIESHFQFPILGHVRDEAMGHVAQLPNGRRDEDYKLDLESFRILRQNLAFLDHDSPPRSIIVTSALPEEGKTTVAASLAFAMASAGRLTLLVECDLRRPALSTRLGIERSPGISEFLSGNATPDEILRTIEFSDPTSFNGDGPAENGAAPVAPRHKLVCIPAGEPTPMAAELLGSERFSEFLKQVREVYDVVIIDSSPLLPVADTLEMLPHVEGIIVCARELQTTRDQALAAKGALSHYPERPTGVVVTGVKPARDDYEVYAYAYGYR